MIIKGVNVIDGAGGSFLTKALIQIEGSLISWVGPESDFEGSINDSEVIDGNGMTVLPGLINCHVHLASNGEPNPSMRAGLSEGEEALRAIRNAAKNLAAGVTTVRDCGTRSRAVIQLMSFIQNGMFLGPRIIPSGRCLTVTGGHGYWSGCEVDGVEDMRKTVREEIKAGAQWIKVIPTGGVLTPGTEIDFASYSIEELSVAVREAKKFGCKVAAHAIGNTGIKNALLAGVDSIEHGSYLDEEAVTMMLENEVFHVPTLSAYYQVVTNGVKAGIHPGSVRKAKEAHYSNTKSFIRSLESGVNVAAGTDAGTPFNYHGSIALEIQLMIEAGVTPLRAISIATLGGARLLGLENKIGTIEEGKEADLVFFYGNPIENIEVLYTPAAVIKSGYLVPIGEKGLEACFIF